VTELKVGDRVLALGEIVDLSEDGEAHVEFTEGSDGGAWVPLSSLQSAPPPPYTDPELVPGMVVMSEDRSDDREWFVIDIGEGAVGFRNFADVRFRRALLPDEIRVVHDPRQVTS
jgi:hypothetical protein